MTIRRGTPISRALALLIASAPLLLAVGLFVAWASAKWVDGGRELAAVEQRRHEADARKTQARLYAPLGEAWVGYAETDASGLSLEESEAEAEQAVRTRIEGMFDKAKGALIAVERLPDAASEREGLHRLRFEFSGTTPEQATPEFLSELESATPYLFVEFLDIERDENARKSLRLRVRLSLYRLKKGEA